MDENKKGFEQSGEIDLVDFSANREMERIRENDRIESEKRRRKTEQERREQLRKARKKQRIKDAIKAWSIVLGCIAALVVIILLVFRGCGDDDAVETKKTPETGSLVSDEEQKLVKDFKASGKIVYGGSRAEALQSMAQSMIIVPSGQEGFVTHTSEYAFLAEALMWNSGFGRIEEIKKELQTCPVYSNGYVQSSPSQMRSTVTGAYLYDTQAAFINAVYEVCKYEGDSSFVNSSILEKLEKIAGYYMDKTDIYHGGGIRYNFRYFKEDNMLKVEETNDGLVYICTDENLGTSGAKPSNIFLSYNFGHLDCYNNLVFNNAMVSMSKIYDMKIHEIEAKETKTADDEAKINLYTQKRDEYASIAKTNKEAINATFYDNEKGRYIGYINVDGQKYDYGFTAINLLAVYLGIADEEKKQSIMSWIDGGRNVDGDAVSSSDILAGALPVFSTVEVTGDISWNTIEGKYVRDGGLGSIWLYGGRSALSGYYRINSLGHEQKKNAVQKLIGDYENGSFVLPDEANPVSEPDIHYSLLASTVLKEYFGVSVEGEVLTVNPMFAISENAGLKNIYFKKNHYDVLYNNKDVYIMLEERQPVRMRLGGFTPGTTVVATLVDGERISSVKNITADNGGFVEIVEKFGNTSYIKLAAQ